MGQGILVHLTRDGQPIFANQGYQRLAIAQLANAETIPVVLGVTHRQAYRCGIYADFMQTYGVRLKC